MVVAFYLLVVIEYTRTFILVDFYCMHVVLSLL